MAGLSNGKKIRYFIVAVGVNAGEGRKFEFGSCEWIKNGS